MGYVYCENNIISTKIEAFKDIAWQKVGTM